MRRLQASLQRRLLSHLRHCCPRNVNAFATAVDRDDSIAGGSKQGSQEGTFEKNGILHEQGVIEKELPEIRDALQDEGQGAGKSITEEELKQRKTSAVRAWMEKTVGRDKIEVAQILKDHGALVRGGPEQGQKLMEALMAWKHQPPTK